ncbi:MAG: helix-turn-helix transcriptional regulator, partial [Lachnospiraceae bacterium]|nr:helix-turn-helix transcriptional regulator [Lachnospiraceae bacterium]
MTKNETLRIDPDEIRSLLFENAEKGYIHPTHREDMLRYDYLKQGDMRAVEEAYRTMDEKMQGKLSPDPVRNMKYLFVVTTALASRFVVEAGVPLETAYAISDLYIQRADSLGTVQEIRNLVKELYATYVGEVNKARQENQYSKPVMRCLNYMESHFNEKITVSELAGHVGLNPRYLSTIFKKEKGMTITEYLTSMRIEVACSLLARTEYTYAQIAYSLAFCSQSHFCGVFRQKTGYTPHQYRIRFYDINI